MPDCESLGQYLSAPRSFGRGVWGGRLHQSRLSNHLCKLSVV